MGKTAMCIKMLEILNTGRVYKVSELADFLETNPRNIVEYKKELEECGYYIESIPGRYGGYKIEKNNVIPALKLMPEEKDCFLEAYNFLMSKNDFLKKGVYSKTIGKISSTIQLPENTNDLLVVDHYQLTMNESEIKERYDFIETAIKKKLAVEIEYRSIKNGDKVHVLHPYKLFLFNNTWFFLALNPEVGEIWYFKLNRIKKWKTLNEKFRVIRGFKVEDYFDGSGFRNNGQYIHVELLAKGIRKHLLKERQYGKNQVVTEINDDQVKVSLDMQNEDQIVSFILGCGTDVVLLSPEYLVNKVKNKAIEIKNQYENVGTYYEKN